MVKIANGFVDTLPDKKRRAKLEEKHLRIFFEILDENGDGKLEMNEIHDVIKKRDFYSSGKNDV